MQPRTVKDCAEQLAHEQAVTVGLSVEEVAGLALAVNLP